MLIPLIDADEQCGAKAANLAHLLRAGFAVPPGVVVLEVLSGDSWVPELRAALRDAGAAPVAVRSSAVGEDGAVASFAGHPVTGSQPAFVTPRSKSTSTSWAPKRTAGPPTPPTPAMEDGH